MLDEQSKQKVKELCDRIAKEQDHKHFSVLIAQLNQLLEDCDGRSGSNHGDPSTSANNIS